MKKTKPKKKKKDAASFYFAEVALHEVDLADAAELLLEYVNLKAAHI